MGRGDAISLSSLQGRGQTIHTTLYIGRAVEHLCAAGHPAPDHLLAHTAPLGWTHISRTGDYLWREPDAAADDFLPLRLNKRLSSVA